MCVLSLLQEEASTFSFKKDFLPGIFRVGFPSSKVYHFDMLLAKINLVILRFRKSFDFLTRPFSTLEKSYKISNSSQTKVIIEKAYKI